MGELERLGESDEWAKTLIWLLGKCGWTITVRPALGSGRLVLAERGGCRIQNAGGTLAAATYPVFRAAMKTRRLALVK